jgi:membrane fusion protein (multidrug efflux system)
MKTQQLVVVFILTLLLSCSQNETANTPEGKKQKLQQLLGQKDALAKQIASLEKELGTNEAEAVKNAIAVSIVTAEYQVLERYVDVKGAVESRSMAMVSPSMGGRVIRMNVKPGQSVAKGQVLFVIESDIMEKALDELQLQYDFAKTVYEKQKSIWEQKAGSEIQYLQAKNQVESLEKRIISTKEQLRQLTVRAPISGVVDRVSLNNGEMAVPGMPAMQIVSLSDLHVAAEVSEAYINSVNKGDKVVLSFPELGITDYVSKVGVLSKAIDPSKRTFRIEVPLTKRPENIRPNLLCSIAINDKTQANALVVPLSAIQYDADKKFVFTYETKGKVNVAVKKQVATGLVQGNTIEVIEGLKAGDKIVNSGAQSLSDGQSIKF